MNNQDNHSPIAVDAEFLRRAEQASREFKENGLHVTMDEMSAWLETWGTDHEQPIPICHT